MTTSLTKSTIPAYNPENDYFSPRQVPRVKQEAMNNYYKNRGSLDMTLSNTQETEKVYAPKVKYEVAEKAYLKNRGNYFLNLIGILSAIYGKFFYYESYIGLLVK
jgi:hypothetical protein